MFDTIIIISITCIIIITIIIIIVRRDVYDREARRGGQAADGRLQEVGAGGSGGEARCFI